MSGTVRSPLLWISSALLFAACGHSRSDDGNTGVTTGGPTVIAGRSAEAGSGGRTASAGSNGRAGRGGDCEAIAPPLSPAILQPASVGQPYVQVLTVIGAGPSQVEWSTHGALPPGLSLAPIAESPPGQPQAQAHLRGLPSMAGVFNFEVQASLIATGPCAAAPAIREYELLVTGDPDADAGAL